MCITWAQEDRHQLDNSLRACAEVNEGNESRKRAPTKEVNWWQTITGGSHWYERTGRFSLKLLCSKRDWITQQRYEGVFWKRRGVIQSVLTTSAITGELIPWRKLYMYCDMKNSYTCSCGVKAMRACKIAQYALRFIDIYHSYIFRACYLHCVLALKVGSVSLANSPVEIQILFACAVQSTGSFVVTSAV